MPNGKHGKWKAPPPPRTPFWKRLLILGIKVAIVIAAATLALEYTWIVVVALALGAAGYAALQFLSQTRLTAHLLTEIATLLSASGIGAGLHLIDFHPGAVIITTLVAYAVLRVLAAWLGRVRYWYRRGTQGRKTWKCPNCRSHRYRVGGDFVPHCYQCDWRPGFPVLRWVRYSVFAQQAWRTLQRARIRLFLFSVITVTLVVVLTIGTGVGLPISSQVDNPLTGDAQLNGGGGDSIPLRATSQDSDSTSSGTPMKASQQRQTPVVLSQNGYDPAAVERHFIELWNAERKEQGLEPISQREDLAKMGAAHSAVMAREGEIGHVEPDGTTIEDRYRNRNLLPECRLDIPSSTEYYPGAENAAQTWVDERVTISETGTTTYVSSEEDLAAVLFEIWMNSPPHRRPMFLPATDEAGLGLNITNSGAVYASLEMC